MRFTVDSAASGQRLDRFLQDQFRGAADGPSRARLQAWIKEGRVLVDGQTLKASQLLRSGQRVDVFPAHAPPLRAEPEDLPVRVLYQDESVIAVDKPAGLIVHAGAGAHSGTLVNRLVHHFQTLSGVGGELRPGIVHRLDKDTSGVLLVARTDSAHRSLAAQFARRTMEKTYRALVHGNLRNDSGRIALPIARDPVRRTRMTVKLRVGRDAFTEYRVLERFEKFTYLEVRIGTGRTHQIRVHLASEGHPVAGDRLYGAPAAERLFLHAWRISFTSPAPSPASNQRVTVESPLPEELSEWLNRLRAAAATRHV
jgi:23S rRNA pseudouridine1911/1915/1917 synthase